VALESRQTTLASLKVFKVFIHELLTFERSPRVPEPDLVMDRPEQVEAYSKAGAEGGTMAPVYLFHTAQISHVIRPGDQVVDLACGSANQLAQVARLNPDCHFLGVDLSPRMLDRARALVKEQGLRNCEFKLADITDLSFLADSHADAVTSTLAFHHLPDAKLLQASFKEAARILKPGGGVYFADLGHLHAESSIDYFGHQYADRQPEIFTEDYLNSLRAAFSMSDFKQAAQVFGQRVKVLSTFLVPYMMVVKTANRRPSDQQLSVALRGLRQSMPAYHQTDLQDLILFFRAGGLASPYFN